MKKCTKCNEFKTLDYFSQDKSKKDGKYSSCKECKRKNDYQWRNNNKDKKKETNHNYYKHNSDKIKKTSKDWFTNNHEHALKIKKKWYNNNFDKVKFLRKEYKERDQGKWKLYMKVYQRNRYKTNIQYRIKTICNKRIRDYVKNKSLKTLDILGCSMDFFINWIEYQFNDYMNWDNQGSYWDFDHVRPCTSFNLTDHDDILSCYNWSNLRPCEKKENMSKHNKIIDDLIIKQDELVAKFKSLTMTHQG